MISQKSIQEVIDTASVVDVVSEYVELKNRGVNRIGLCPFHNEKTPSFTVSPSKNIYKCFGCGKGGGPVQFLMEHEQISFPEAIRSLAKRYNIEIEEDFKKDDNYEENKLRLESLNIINQFAYDYFQDQLHNTIDGQKIGLSYLKERGFLDKTIKDFGLGYSPSSGEDFIKTATSKGYKLDLLKSLGLVSSSSGKDFFRGRIIFPILSLSGKPIAFSGRTLSASKKTPKYINSPETDVYSKRKVLYGLNLAKKSIRTLDNCLVVEGYSDVISLHQAGIKNVVASSGTSLTGEQILLIKRSNTNNITLLYDGDNAGVNATLRAIDLILEKDMDPFVLQLEENEDPDTFIKKHGHQAFLDYSDTHKKDFLSYKADLLLKEAGNDPIKKTQVITKLIETLSHINYPIKRDLYVKQCSNLIEIDEQKLITEIDKVVRSRKRLEQNRARYRDAVPSPPSEEPRATQEKNTSSPSVKPKLSKDYYQERDLARLCIQFGGKNIEINEENVFVAEFIYTNIHDIIDHFDNTMYRDIIKEAFEQGSKLDDFDSVKYFTNHKEEDIRTMAIDVSANRYEYASWSDKNVELQTQLKPELNFYKDSLQSILRFKYRKVLATIELLKVKINESNLTDQEQSDYIAAFKKLQEQKTKLAKKLNLVISK